MTENNRIEYKRKLIDGLEKEVIAFLNYHDGGIIWLGIGSACEPMSQHMIEELFARRTRNSIARIRSLRQDLTFEQLKIYYQEAGLTLGDKFAPNLELLTEDGAYNYAGYLLADQNGNSVQVAKYAGTDRVELLESKDYGFCCLVKTCKQILDRLEGVENRVINKITSRERINRSLWNTVALREAVINAIIHNDYSTELVPKFEIFADRLEITSAGAIHSGTEQEDFFAGYSMPRNKTLMRVFKDLDMVEYLGSGMPRILKAYPREAYTFSTHFIRATFPISEEALALEDEVLKGEAITSGAQSGVQSRAQSRAQSEAVLLALTDTPRSAMALTGILGLDTKTGALKRVIKVLLEQGLISYTLPEKPGSRLQKYQLTIKGSSYVKNLNKGQ